MPTDIEEDAKASTEEEKQERKKIRNSQHLLSGLNRVEKHHINKLFWDFVWPALEKLGWTKMEGTRLDEGCSYFIPKGDTKGYARIADILDRLALGRNVEESVIFEEYTDMLQKLYPKPKPLEKPKSPVPLPGTSFEHMLQLVEANARPPEMPITKPPPTKAKPKTAPKSSSSGKTGDEPKRRARPNVIENPKPPPPIPKSSSSDGSKMKRMDETAVAKPPPDAESPPVAEAHPDAKLPLAVDPSPAANPKPAEHTASPGAVEDAKRRALMRTILSPSPKKETREPPDGGEVTGEDSEGHAASLGEVILTGLPRTRNQLNPKAPAPMLDLSWKDGGRNFPKRSSAVGRRHQVAELPEAGTFASKENKDSTAYCSPVWDPKTAAENGIDLDSKDPISAVPSKIKEAALVKLAELGYDEEALAKVVDEIKPTDGSDWNQKQRERFRDEIFRSRKDLVAVSKAMDIPMKTCLTYYFGTFKTSDDYRLMKTVCVDELAVRHESSEHGYDACAICGDGGNLLICDGCEGEYHMECLRPALDRVPEGHWECDECVDRKFLAAREYLVRSTKLFREDGVRKRPWGDTRENSEVIYLPKDDVLAAVKKFANDVSQIVTNGRAPIPTSAQSNNLK